MAIATAAPSEIFFFIASILQENIFDPQLEQVGDAEGEGERRVVFPRLDRVDRLARHFEPLGEIALAPVALGAQDLEAVLHAPRRSEEPTSELKSLMRISYAVFCLKK